MSDEQPITSFKQLFSPVREALNNAHRINALFKDITNNILTTVHDPQQQEVLLKEANEDWRALIAKLDTLNKQEADDGLRVQEEIDTEDEADSDSGNPEDGGSSNAEADESGDETVRKSNAILIFKSKKDDSWRWVGIYSNNFNDRHGHLIKAEAHEEFADAVSAGTAPYPFLMIKHVPLPIGRSDFVHFDKDTGMALAGGYFFKEWEHLAPGIAERAEPQGMSHVMPQVLVVWEKKLGNNPKMPDPGSIIKRYRSVEFSIMDTIDAANILTSLDATKEL